MDFTHADRVSYSVPPRNVSVGLFVQRNINYLTIYFTGQCPAHGCTLRVVKAATVPIFPERNFYSTINQTRYYHIHDRPTVTSPAPLRTITTTNTGFRPRFIPSQQEIHINFDFRQPFVSRSQTEGRDEGINFNENNPLDLRINRTDAFQQRYQLRERRQINLTRSLRELSQLVDSIPSLPETSL